MSRAPIIRASFEAALQPGELVERFRSRIDTNGPVPAHAPELGPCHVWTGGRKKRRDGTPSYGVFTPSKRSFVLAHRYAWALEHGEAAGVVCHRCDNVACVRVAHLFVGTQAENLADMRAKGRGHLNRFPKGERHPNAKITTEVASRIRALRAGGFSLAKIGAAVGLHASTVHGIVRGETWAG